eukprot:TRINITY_DN40872_c0_g1_i1.p3 TRINITY_DN40872_c0_g1~~TRINITY_DN40872_c0_g1_i1.p3  ORF type:complete len:120 (+),score=9.53 TRINITY_DN40872_c0_g1_i1:1093-1452(+)
MNIFLLFLLLLILWLASFFSSLPPCLGGLVNYPRLFLGSLRIFIVSSCFVGPVLNDLVYRCLVASAYAWACYVSFFAFSKSCLLSQRYCVHPCALPSTFASTGAFSFLFLFFLFLGFDQ